MRREDPIVRDLKIARDMYRKKLSNPALKCVDSGFIYKGILRHPITLKSKLLDGAKLPCHLHNHGADKLAIKSLPYAIDCITELLDEADGYETVEQLIERGKPFFNHRAKCRAARKQGRAMERERDNERDKEEDDLPEM